MKTLYIDCGMGAAGDMLMGALLSLLPEGEREKFLYELSRAGIPGVCVAAYEDSKCGIVGTHVRVTVRGTEECVDEREQGVHHGHHHHSSMDDIMGIVSRLQVSPKVRQDIGAVYRMIARAESAVHGVEVSEIHFHEVGMMDALADIAGCAMLMERIAPERVVVSPVNVGFGRVKCAHGILPVPAPATENLLRDVPSYVGETEGELCTPTGAALLKYYSTSFSRQPAMMVKAVGYGTGKKDFETANVLRVLLGETDDDGGSGKCAGADGGREAVRQQHGFADSVVQLQCNLDDMTGEEIGYAAELLMEQGALDVFTVPIGMKKSRPGILLTVLCREEDRERMAELVFCHTTTIGIRWQRCSRMVMERQETERAGSFGRVSVKHSRGYGVEKEKPEYEDVKGVAREQGLSLREAGYLVMEEIGQQKSEECRPEAVTSAGQPETAASECRPEAVTSAGQLETAASECQPEAALWEKYERLKEVLRGMGAVAVAFSGGVDSTFLLKTAHDVLGDCAVAVTVRSAFFPRREDAEAAAFCTKAHIRQIVIDFDERGVEGLCKNPTDRCYRCKRAMFAEMQEKVREQGAYTLAEGTNADDEKDYRPGMRAIAELQVASPLRQLGFSKKEIRCLSRVLGLGTWDKPSLACLATRIPYGEPLTREKLAMAEAAEQALSDLGFHQVRVRLHGNLARIEVSPEEMSRLAEPDMRRQVTEQLTGLGCAYVSLDLAGYRTGSMNLMIKN